MGRGGEEGTPPHHTYSGLPLGLMDQTTFSYPPPFHPPLSPALPASPRTLPNRAVAWEERPPMPVMQPTPERSDTTPVTSGLLPVVASMAAYLNPTSQG